MRHLCCCHLCRCLVQPYPCIYPPPCVPLPKVWGLQAPRSSYATTSNCPHPALSNRFVAVATGTAVDAPCTPIQVSGASQCGGMLRDPTAGPVACPRPCAHCPPRGYHSHRPLARPSRPPGARPERARPRHPSTSLSSAPPKPPSCRAPPAASSFFIRHGPDPNPHRRPAPPLRGGGWGARRSPGAAGAPWGRGRGPCSQDGPCGHGGDPRLLHSPRSDGGRHG